MTRTLIGKRKRRAPLVAPQKILTRHISVSVLALLWGRAAGRCEFRGCNKVLWRSSLTQERINLGQKAHIYSFSSNGPRGNAGVRTENLNGHENLMLVCPECHIKIDDAPDGGRYTVAVLQAMKLQHERRIEIVTGIEPGKQSHVLLYGANIGEHSSPKLLDEAASAMFPHRYPAEATPISLGTFDSSCRDRTQSFWDVEANGLRTQFDRRVSERLASGEIKHLSVFALAPQPLLIQFGALLGDITPADVYQRHREPQTWNWPSPSPTPDFEIHRPLATNGTPVLLVALSATVTLDRITAVLGSNANIWIVTITSPHNDITKSREQVGRFRAVMRTMLDSIKAAHGQNSLLHVFPVMSAALAVELGRIRMPKADMPWKIYDQLNSRGGFVHALSIP